MSSADLREIKTTILNVFNDKFLEEIAEKVTQMVEKKFEERLKEQSIINSALQQKTTNLEKENITLRRMIDDQEQSLRNYNLRIFGIKYENGEDVYNKVFRLFKEKLKINIQNTDIDKCFRVSAKTISNKPPAVFVRIRSDTVRFDILKNRKLLKNSGYMIKEDLTKMRLSLFYMALREFSFKNSWVSNGNIYVKCNNIVHRINHEDDIYQLKNTQ